MTTQVDAPAPLLLDQHRVPVLRPITDDDRPALAAFLSGLSPRSTLQRFFIGGFRVTRATLDVLTHPSTGGRAFVAVEGERIVGHAMWAAAPHVPDHVDIGFVVAEDRRGQGLATALTRLAIADAADHGASTIQATTLTSNRIARRVIRHLLPCAISSFEGGETTYVAAVGPCTGLLGAA